MRVEALRLGTDLSNETRPRRPPALALGGDDLVGLVENLRLQFPDPGEQSGLGPRDIQQSKGLDRQLTLVENLAQHRTQLEDTGGPGQDAMNLGSIDGVQGPAQIDGLDDHHPRRPRVLGSRLEQEVVTKVVDPTLLVDEDRGLPTI